MEHECGVCHGTGGIDDEKCWNCDGTGKVPGTVDQSVVADTNSYFELGDDNIPF